MDDTAHSFGAYFALIWILNTLSHLEVESLKTKINGYYQ
jgi:hypothetical protein